MNIKLSFWIAISFSFLVHINGNQAAAKCSPDAGAPIPFSSGDKMGYMDAARQIVIAPNFEVALRFYNGMAEVHSNGKYGFIDPEGAIVIKPEYDGAKHFCGGLAAVLRGGHWGFVNKTGKTVVPFIFDGVFDFSEGRAAVKKGSLWGFVDRSGRLIVPLKYSLVGDFNEGLAAVEETAIIKQNVSSAEADRRNGYIDLNGRPVIRPAYYYAGDFNGGIAHVRFDDPKKGLVDGYIFRSGRIAVPFSSRNYECSDFSDGLAWAAGHFIDRTGRVMIDPKNEYTFGSSFSEGLALIEKSGKFGYIDRSGKMVIPAIFEDGRADGGLGSFSEGMAPVKLGGKFGYIDKKGTIVIAPKYHKALQFESGYAWVENEKGEGGYIGRDGTEYFEH